MELKPVLVRWIDAKGPTDDWHSGDEPAVECEDVTSVGFLVARTDRHVVIAQSRGGQDGDRRGEFAIPAGCVTSVVYLTEGGAA